MTFFRHSRTATIPPERHPQQIGLPLTKAIDLATKWMDNKPAKCVLPYLDTHPLTQSDLELEPPGTSDNTDANIGWNSSGN